MMRRSLKQARKTYYNKHRRTAFVTSLVFGSFDKGKQKQTKLTWVVGDENLDPAWLRFAPCAENDAIKAAVWTKKGWMEADLAQKRATDPCYYPASLQHVRNERGLIGLAHTLKHLGMTTEEAAWTCLVWIEREEADRQDAEEQAQYEQSARNMAYQEHEQWLHNQHSAAENEVRALCAEDLEMQREEWQEV